MLEHLPWDTEFFGYRVGRLPAGMPPQVPVSAVVEAARQQGYRLLYWLVAPNDAAAQAVARALGAYLADHKVTYTMPVPAGTALPLPDHIAPTTTLTPQLVRLALAAGNYSRYRTDPGFAPGAYERLYTSWIENSVSGQLAREVLVYRTATEVPEAGLITLGLTGERVDIGLLAVSAQLHGQGIGTQLVAAARQRAQSWHYDTLQVITQRANRGACRFYERCGFELEQVEDLYHIWLH